VSGPPISRARSDAGGSRDSNITLNRGLIRRRQGGPLAGSGSNASPAIMLKATNPRVPRTAARAPSRQT